MKSVPADWRPWIINLKTPKYDRLALGTAKYWTRNLQSDWEYLNTSRNSFWKHETGSQVFSLNSIHLFLVTIRDFSKQFCLRIVTALTNYYCYFAFMSFWYIDELKNVSWSDDFDVNIEKYFVQSTNILVYWLICITKNWILFCGTLIVVNQNGHVWCQSNLIPMMTRWSGWYLGLHYKHR